ncbi:MULTISPECIES: hypothetical protein [Ralstonia solanacearum species complex]|uniref:hypothetical protein n=1 Tax=Ralstonia solanacearum species complex TaxID=3116862 RepID=UPI000E5681E9|nr:hypothetical protein [Ralstonia solanacearum]BEU74718.1 hypothetical protein MAFF211271_42730 [Ralstonia pseudosolanacearum]AXV79546.1 hypothetical protein CJO76_21795 [Ralstonia solanacearum]AXV93574.1 hypothetical protein CJO79_21775 [Ralstonia solanacearum]AXW21583.1 hypothetical protein CJO85_21875 [Ralstonia solanacearum]AXW78464.1 hypothetical protein CJO97_21775 [Ralstonia solanacearum]
MNGPLASPANPGQVERPLTETHWMARGRAIVLTLIGINVVGGRFLWKVVRCGQEPLELAVILSAMITVMIGAPFVNSMDGTDGAHAAAVFALGAFPVDALLKIIRRLGFPQFTDFEKKERPPDRLLSLNGATLPIVSVFEAEGINSVEPVAAVAAADPVLLARITPLDPAL